MGVLEKSNRGGDGGGNPISQIRKNLAKKNNEIQQKTRS